MGDDSRGVFLPHRSHAQAGYARVWGGAFNGVTSAVGRMMRVRPCRSTSYTLIVIGMRNLAAKLPTVPRPGARAGPDRAGVRCPDRAAEEREEA